ncbi:hypothetical protein ALC57_16665 [Trachymyrmex cornetzi]|uniref:Uncharacterized protein n=1 Tax=Trachymyrmex cornetzi TaxID=471704 RepID=A0A151IUN3_9HYME|nr:hypothetical protein ALC57_16665 [Trachymyrmex cornetzi]
MYSSRSSRNTDPPVATIRSISMTLRIAKPNFHSSSVFAKNLIVIEMRKLEMKFDKPIYVCIQKGVKSNVVARTITYEDYTRCLNEEIEMTRRQSCIRSKLHEVYTISESKVGLNPYDDKRYVGLDGDVTMGSLADIFVIYVSYVLYYVFFKILHMINTNYRNQSFTRSSWILILV